MCGIAGIYSYTNEVISKTILKSMSDLMIHRGPDGDGFYSGHHIGLCHRRLKVIDLSAEADQPFISENGRYVISFNGECYNYLELRTELEKDGHNFVTHSDTEVLVIGFSHWKEELFQKINGMFAIAIWDNEKEELILARDRFGIKPLYITTIEERLYFSSEIKPLLMQRKETKLNYDSIYDYLTLRYVPTNKTLFNGVESLPPGEFLIINKTGQKIKKYWSLNYKEPKSKFNKSDLSKLISSSMKYRMRSDVKVGSYLSSGIDSSVIAYLAKQQGHILDTFTYDIKGQQSELLMANKTASDLGHRSHVVEEDELLKLKEIIESLEEPIGDSIILPTSFLSKKASSHVTVVLSGEGADEVFNGYAHHKVLYLLNKFKSFLPILKYIKPFIPIWLINRLTSYSEKFDRKTVDRVINQIQSFDGSMKECRNIIRLFTREELKELLTDEFYLKIKPSSVEETENGFLNNLTEMDMRDWNSKYTLLRMDRLGMANSIESRFPYLDHRIVEYVINLKDKNRISMNKQKIALRGSMVESTLPEEIINRKKQAFLMPLSGARFTKFQKSIENHFDERKLEESPFWKGEVVSRLINKGEKRTFVDTKKLFCIYVFDLWFDIFKEKGLVA
jgi:asparagine synthase (glutamine-hydrolysing)